MDITGQIVAAHAGLNADRQPTTGIPRRNFGELAGTQTATETLVRGGEVRLSHPVMVVRLPATP
jgi:hypothetical protein